MPQPRRRSGISTVFMAIKDEVYVAWLLSSEEKYEQDRERYNVRPELGDRMIHRHLNRPEFTFGKRTLRFQAQDSALDASPHAPGQIPAPPSPHLGRPRARIPLLVFRSRDQFVAPANPASYATWLKLLRLPEEATGYREVRYPRMELAQKRAEELLQLAGSRCSGGL